MSDTSVTSAGASQPPGARPARSQSWSAEPLERLFRLSLDMLGTARDGYLTGLNPAWERTLGWSRDELMAEPFLSFVHPDDVEATIATAAVLAEPGRQELVSFENRYRTSAGDYRWIEWSCTAEDGIVYFVAKDVTARKALEVEREEDLRRIRRSETLHRTLTANLPDTTVFLLDHDLRIQLADGAAVRRLPWFNEDLFIGRRVNELDATVPAEVLDLATENYRAALRGERRTFDVSSGGLRFAIDAVPVFSEDGDVDGALVVARDVTEQQQLTDGLRHSEQRLRKAEELVGGGSWELTLDDQTLVWSDGFDRIHGALPADGRGPLSAYVERIDAADRAHFSDEIARCEREGRAAFEYRISGSSGTVRTLTVEAEVVDSTLGRAPFVRGAVLDVTDERAGFDAAPIGMLVAEPKQLRLVRVNDAFCSMLRRSREQLLGQRLIDLTHPEDHGALAEQEQVLVSGATGTYETEKRYLRSDGGVVWAAVYMTVLHDSDGSVQAFSSQVIDVTEAKNRAAELEAARVESLHRLAIATEYRDNETFEHTERVGLISVAIGRAIGLSEPQLDLLRQAAPLHDIGKVGVSDAILLKPGRFTPEERETMKRHALIGADILVGSNSPVLTMAEAIALTHHERWDGHGYPSGLVGDAIPLVGRIVAVADVFDALTHERPYKEAWRRDQAVDYIRAESGSAFDPSIVSAFTGLDHATMAESEPREDGGGRARARDEMRRAQIDSVMGALGRGQGTVMLGREINRARRGNGRLVLAAVGVNGLKQVHERDGLAAGDVLLRDVVDAIQQGLRSCDPVVRWSGDEFVCALVDATTHNARCRFEEIQAAIAQARPGAGISFGLAELRPKDSLEELAARGERALCEARAQAGAPSRSDRGFTARG